MQDKQKVTLYLPTGVHRQLKIKAAIDDAPMSGIVERAIAFYLQHPDKVEEVEAAAYGKAYQVHVCPECEAALLMRDGQMASLKNQPSIIDDEFSIDVRESVPLSVDGTQAKEVLVPC